MVLDKNNHRYSIEELFDIMEFVLKNDFDGMTKKFGKDSPKFSYMLIKLREGGFIKFNNNGDKEDMPMFISNPFLTFKGHEYLKMWNTLWVKHQIKDVYGHRLSDLNMTTYMNLANKLFLEKKPV